MIIDTERGSTVVAVLHGDMHIRDGYPVYQVNRFPVEARRISAESARQQPSRLLAAECQVVPFSGRERQLGELSSWRDDPMPGVSIKLAHGPGGQGKTRLAAQFAAECGTAGWTAWAAHHLSDPTAQHVVAPGDPGQNLVLIADYADRWPLSDLLLLLANPLLRHSRRARVVLLARSAGPWWTSLCHRLSGTEVEVGSTMGLPPLADTTSAQRGAFISARNSFADVFGIPASSAPVPERMDGDAFHLVLTVHLAALVAVDACWRRTEPPRDPVGLSAYLLDREHDFWRALHDHERIAITPTVMSRTVYTATLTQPLHRELAQAALQRAGVTDPVSAVRALDDHAACYPPRAGADTRLEPLRPDRLGEDFIALATPGHERPDYEPDVWAESAPARLLAYRDEESLPYTRPVVNALIETARRWPHVAERQLNPLLRESPQLAIGAGGNALVGLAQLASVEREVLEAIEGTLPDHRHMDLDLGIAALTTRLTALRLAETDDPGLRASLYHTAGKRFAHAGLTGEALTAMAKAVEIRERLVIDKPGACERELALSLNNLGKALTDGGDHERALTLTSRAVDVYRQLPRAGQDPDEIGLARALHNRAAVLWLLGRHEHALTAIEEAAEIRLRLAAGDGGPREPDLVLTVTNLGAILSSLGRREQALSASSTAVDLWRRLAADNPAEHIPDLARALSNFAADLADAGRHEEALDVASEAVGVYRRLRGLNRAAHEPGLAIGLRNLAAQLSAMGRPDDALAATEEALEIAQRLAADNPVAYGLALATALDKHGVMLAGAERWQDALTAIEAAVGTLQRLAASNPAAYEPALAESLNNLGKVLFDSGRSKQALVTATRATDVYRQLADMNPAAHEPGLAMALGNLGMILLDSRRHRQALAATSESLALYRRLALTDGAPSEIDFAKALYRFAFVRSVAGRDLPAALDAVVEAIRILERLVGGHASALTEFLLAAYAGAAAVLDQLGSKDEAIDIRRLVERASGPLRGTS